MLLHFYVDNPAGSQEFMGTEFKYHCDWKIFLSSAQYNNDMWKIVQSLNLTARAPGNLYSYVQVYLQSECNDLNNPLESLYYYIIQDTLGTAWSILIRFPHFRGNSYTSSMHNNSHFSFHTCGYYATACIIKEYHSDWLVLNQYIIHCCWACKNQESTLIHVYYQTLSSGVRKGG